MKFKKLNLILIALIGVGMISLFFKAVKQEDEFVVVDVLGSGKKWLVGSITTTAVMVG